MVDADSASNIVLSNDELLAIAAELMQTERRAETLVVLKALLERTPTDGRALYLLAAEHAALGLFDQAESEYAAAVELCPQIPEARLQFVMLLLSRHKTADAVVQWEKLRETRASALVTACTETLGCLLRGELDAAEAAAKSLDTSVATERALCESTRQFVLTVAQQLRAEVAERTPRYLGSYARLAD